MLWKAYFWPFIVFLGLAGLVDSNWRSVDYISVADLVIALIGMYGYAFSRKLGPKWLWQILTIVVIAFWYSYTFYLDKKYGGTPSKDAWDYLVTAILPLPIFIADAFYATDRKILLD